MRVLVIGGEGLLGSAVMRQLAAEEVDRKSISRRSDPSLDITSLDSILRAMDNFAPDGVILTAAAVDVDGLESDPDRGYRVNALGPRNVAEACRRSGIRMSLVSTDFVFNGRKEGPYTEFDAPDPLNVYGRTKLAGEHAVLSAGGGHQVVRVSYIYGPDGPCFPARLLHGARSGQPLRLIQDTCISPTSTRQAARLLVRLLRVGAPGLYHVAGRGSTTPLGLAKALLEAAGLPTDSVQAIHAADWTAPAARPRNSALFPYVLELEGQNDLEPWEEEVDAFAREWVRMHEG